MNMNRMTHLLAALAATGVLLVGGVASAENAPYVGTYEADNFFSTITSNEMAALRTKKILFASRSFGLNMRDGLDRLKVKNPMHDLLNSYIRYDVLGAGGDLSIIPTNVFSSYNFVHFLCSLNPLTKRLDEVETLLRQAPYSFGNQVDVVMVYYHTATAAVFDTYTNKMDTLQADFPNIKFIYVTSGLSGPQYYSNNTNSAAFGALVRAKYKGNAPLYDLGYILSNDGGCGDVFCPENSDDPTGLHPNSAIGEERMGKAFLLMMRDLYFGSGCTNFTPPTVPSNLTGTALSDSSIKLAWDVSTHECGIARYELTRNGTPLASLTKTNYTDTGLTENTAYRYAVRAVSMAEIASAYSATSTVSTLVDSTAPTVTVVRAVSGTEVSVEFTETMDPVTCGVATNYAINYGVSVLSASLSGKIVTLTTSAMADGTNYTLTLNRVADGSSAKNPIAAGAQAVFTYVRVLYPSDPTAYWTFNGTLNDASGNGLNGTWSSATNFGAGLLGQGVTLSGATNGSYPQVVNNALLGGMSQLTVSMWARKNSATVAGTLLMKSGAYYITVNDNNSLKVNIQAAASVVLTPTVTDLNNTNWHHYCLVYDGTNASMYVDGGSPRNSKALTGNVVANTIKLSIGKNEVNTPYATFAGDIDEVKLFRRALSTNEINALVSGGISGRVDRIAVRALLDANGLTNKQVDALSVYEKDRITKLYLQEGGVSNITANIGQLSELTLLHVYGDRALGHPLLSRVAPEIGSCTKLTELLLAQNSLTNLPTAITNLTKLTVCSIGENLLCGSYPWENWADTYDSDWRASQNCPASLFYIYSILNGPGSVFPTNRLAVSAGQSTQLVYSAHGWHEITNFVGNGASVPAAVGRPAYTAVYANVSADITNEVTFAVTKAPADGQTPATWYGPLGANPAVADEDQDNLSLNQEYLINSSPTQSNAFRMISANLDSQQHVSLSWRSMGLPNGQVQIGLQTELNGAFTYPSGMTVYSNGVCTWRSSTPATNDTGFVRLKINGTP